MEHSLAFAMELDSFLESGLTIHAYDQICREEVAEAMRHNGVAVPTHNGSITEEQQPGYRWGGSSDDAVLTDAARVQSKRGEAEEVLQISSDSSDDDEAWEVTHGHSFGLMDQ